MVSSPYGATPRELCLLMHTHSVRGIKIIRGCIIFLSVAPLKELIYRQHFSSLKMLRRHIYINLHSLGVCNGFQHINDGLLTDVCDRFWQIYNKFYTWRWNLRGCRCYPRQQVGPPLHTHVCDVWLVVCVF